MSKPKPKPREVVNHDHGYMNVTLSLSAAAILQICRRTHTGLYGKTYRETAAILLLEKLREIQQPEP